MTNVDKTIEHLEALFERISGQKPLAAPANAQPINANVDPSILLDARMTQLLHMLQDPALRAQLQPWAPPVSVWESEERITLCLNVAGINKGDIDIALRDGFLAVTGVRRSINEPSTHSRPRLTEIPCGRFQRLIALPPGLNTPEITSTLKDGILEITLAKTEAKSPGKKGKSLQ